MNQRVFTTDWEAELETSEICSLKIKDEGYQSHKSFIIVPLCGIWQHGLCLSATDYTHVISPITQERNIHQSLLLRDRLNYVN